MLVTLLLGIATSCYPQAIQLKTNIAHNDDIIQLVRSPDNTCFATVGRLSEVKVWDMKSTTLLNTFDLSQFHVNGLDVSVAFIPKTNQLGMKLHRGDSLVIYDFIKDTITACYEIPKRPSVNRDDYLFFIDEHTVAAVEQISADNVRWELVTYGLPGLTRKVVREIGMIDNATFFHIAQTPRGIIYCVRQSNQLRFYTWLGKPLLDIEIPKWIMEDPLIDIENNIRLAFSAQHRYISINYPDRICVHDLENGKGLVIDSTVLRYRDFYPNVSVFSEDERVLLYTDNNHGGIDKDRIVVFDLQSKEILNELTVDSNIAFVLDDFIETGRLIYAYRGNQVLKANLSQHELRPIHAVDNDLVSFDMSGSRIMGGFSDNRILIFDLKTAGLRTVRVADDSWRLHQVSFVGKSIYTALKRDNQLLVKVIDGERLIIEDSVALSPTKGYVSAFRQDTLNGRIALVLKYLGGGQPRIRLLAQDAKSELHEVPIFENRRYENLYFTDNNRQLVGYVAGSGSYVFDAKTYGYLSFWPKALYFKDYENITTLEDEITSDSVRLTVECFDCDMGFREVDTVVYAPTGRIVARTPAEADRYLSFDDDPLQHLWAMQIVQHDEIVEFRQNGNTVFAFRLSDLSLVDRHNAPDSAFRFTNNDTAFFARLGTGLNAPVDTIQGIHWLDGSNGNPIGQQPVDRLIGLTYLNNSYLLLHQLKPDRSSYFYDENGMIWVEGHASMYSALQEDDVEKKMLFRINPSQPRKSESIRLVSRYDVSRIATPLDEANPVSVLGGQLFGNLAPSDRYDEGLVALKIDRGRGDELELDVARGNFMVTAWETLYQWKRPNILEGQFDVSINRKTNAIVLVDKRNHRRRTEILLLNGQDFMIFDEDNYYMATKGVFDYIAFGLAGRIYRPEQFDVKYNRPDLVMQHLGFADRSAIDALYKRYRSRLKKLGISEDALQDDRLPSLHIENFEQLPAVVEERQLTIGLVMHGAASPLHALHVWINNTPIYGEAGRPFTVGKLRIDEKLTLGLANGLNKIQLSVTNAAGLESYKETFFIEQTAVSPPPNLYFIGIGVSHFADSGYNLRYAAKDVKDVASFIARHQRYGHVYTKIFLDTDVALENLTAIRSFLEKASLDDVVICYIASHGLLDDEYQYYIAGHDMEFDHPSHKGIPFDTMNNWFDRIKPLKKILLIDACHSGEVDEEPLFTRVSGVPSAVTARGAKPMAVKEKKTKVPKNSDLLKNLFVDLRRGNGTTILSSAGGLEFAYESDRWRNGLFTYCLLDGLATLSADINGDGKVMLSELQEYVTQRVFKLSGGQQTPTFRLENIAADYVFW